MTQRPRNNVRSHKIKKCYINTFLFNDTDCPFPKFSEVKTGCAVTYTKNGSSEKHTVVIDDSPYTAEWRKEYYPDDPFSKKIMSKKVGDNFNISGIDQQLCKIIEIKSKHEFRLQQFMTEENNQVEDRTMIMINTPIDSNGNLDFSELIKSLSDSNKQRDQKVEFAIKMYKETISSIYIFSRFSNLSLTDTIDYFSQQSELYIYTAQGVKEEWRKCYNLLISKSKVVISPFTAKILIRISAYFELNIFSILRASNLEFCVSEYLLDDLKSEQKIPYSPYRLYLREGKPVIINNEDKIKKYNRALKDCIAFLSLVEIIPGDIAVDDFDLAKKAPKCLVSRSAYHSFKIASGKNMILWDDDSNIVKFYNIQDKTINIKNRVFSQAVFLAFQKMEVMTSSDITEANIFLLASNEYFSSFNAENIKEIFINLDKYSPLDLRLLKYFTSDSIDKKSLLNVTSEAIKIIWKESFNLMAISIIIDAVIENDIQVAKLLICDCLLFTMSNNICNNILEEFLRKYYCPTLPSPNNIDKHVQAS